MNDRTQSPKRRHILSSINPEPPVKRSRRRSASLDSAHDDRSTKQPDSREPRCSSDGGDANTKADANDANRGDGEEGDQTRPRATRLKLKDHKSSRRRRSRSRDRDRDRDRDRHREGSPSRHHRRRDEEEGEIEGKKDEEGDDNDGHRHRHRSSRHKSSRHHHRRRRSRSRHRRHRSPTPPNPHEPAPLDPQSAFLESLFDAMADDEGADHWAAVYGQPVHVYSNERVGPQGELERMTDDEYAAHVRQRMWEKTHEGLLEERARREEARKHKEEETKRERRVQKEVEESLRRGQERRQRKEWESRWAAYVAAWAGANDNSKAGEESSPLVPAWPVESGLRADIGDEKSVRAFFVQGLGLGLGGGAGEKEFAARLKEERVRWHPDKVQQRLGGTVDDKTMQDVTAIFQIIDRLWNELRNG